MDIALLLIVFGVLLIGVVVGILVVRRIKGSGPAMPLPPARPPPAPAPADPVGHVPTFRVVALGLEGAGKTVLLASQFHKLCGPVADRRYFLDGDFRQDQRLSWIYGHVCDTSVPWPPGSLIGETREFLFDCKAIDRTGDARTVFRISYLDYSGDLLEPSDQQHESLGEVEARVENADALLVIIDGRRVLQLLRDEPKGHDYFDRRLQPLLRLARRVSRPVQLILTKWDLVRTFGEPSDGDEACLRQVRDCLKDYVDFESLMHGHGPRQKEVRLIPVSAVGSRFAMLRDDGTVAKRQDGTLDPIDVEVPLYAVLPDVLKQAALSLDLRPDVRKRLDAELHDSLVRNAPRIVHSVLTSPVGAVLRTALSGVVGDEAVKVFVEMLVRRKSHETGPPPGDVEDHEEETERLRTAVIEDMQRVVLLFEARLRSSVLRRTL